MNIESTYMRRIQPSSVKVLSESRGSHSFDSCKEVFEEVKSHSLGPESKPSCTEVVSQQPTDRLKFNFHKKSTLTKERNQSLYSVLNCARDSKKNRTLIPNAQRVKLFSALQDSVQTYNSSIALKGSELHTASEDLSKQIVHPSQDTSTTYQVSGLKRRCAVPHLISLANLGSMTTKRPSVPRPQFFRVPSKSLD